MASTNVKGKNCLIYLGDDGSPADFIALEGQRNANFTLDPARVDVTDKTNNGWRGQENVLNGLTVTCELILKTEGATAPGQDRLWTHVNANTTCWCKLELGSSGRYYEFEGSLSLDGNANFDDVSRMTLTITNVGDVYAVGF